jgi:hypothetical protein
VTWDKHTRTIHTYTHARIHYIHYITCRICIRIRASITLNTLHYTTLHTYVHTYIHTYVRTYVHTYMHTCIHACMHTCIHAYIHTCMHACIHAYTYAYTIIYIYRYIYICLYIYICIQMHAYLLAESVRCIFWFLLSRALNTMQCVDIYQNLRVLGGFGQNCNGCSMCQEHCESILMQFSFSADRFCSWAPLWTFRVLLSSSPRRLQCWRSLGCLAFQGGRVRSG